MLKKHPCRNVCQKLEIWRVQWSENVESRGRIGKQVGLKVTIFDEITPDQCIDPRTDP